MMSTGVSADDRDVHGPGHRPRIPYAAATLVGSPPSRGHKDGVIENDQSFDRKSMRVS